jgi:hypothetical protein
LVSRRPSDLRDADALQHPSERGFDAKALGTAREVRDQDGNLWIGKLCDREDDAPAELARHGEAAISSAHWPALDAT